MRDYKEDPIRVRTDYTFEQVKEFQRVHFRKQRRSILVFLLVVGPGLIPYYLEMHATDGFWEQFFSIPVFGIISPLLFLFIISGVFYTKKVYEKNKNLYGNGDNGIFDHESYESHSENGFRKTKYRDFAKVVETKEMFYLYIVDALVHIVDKNGIENGTVEEIRWLLESNLPKKKYIKRQK